MNARSIPGLTDEAGSFRQETGRSPALRKIFPAASPRRTLLPLSATRLFFAFPLRTTPSPVRPVPRVTLPPLCLAALDRRAIVRLTRVARLFPTTSAPQTRFGLRPLFSTLSLKRRRAVVHVSGYNIV